MYMYVYIVYVYIYILHVYSRVRKPINLSGVNGRMKKKRYLFKLSPYNSARVTWLLSFTLCVVTSLVYNIYL